ncbi:AAA family ATPase [Variovorax guangxiensis]|uniref:Putative ATPase n=1 Tax=Variovorax guangxiensis TaxID=1775474 RepID=A0A840FWT9_9BURK|nr:AAA family ATPase [Variovorax guangxiensis]MBB4223889.1 putative ATPase [Variovorax guangxiensis]
MRLASFQITNFRSINDSGLIDSTQITTILGRNDSGKSNLLRALHSLNPAEGVAELSPIKDFPRHRRLEECTGDTPVVFTRWSLDESEQAELAAILPRAAGVHHVTASRGYAAARSAGFEGLGALSLDVSDTKAKVRKIVPAVKAVAEKVADEAAKAALEQEADVFDAAMIMSPDYIKWSAGAIKAAQALRKALAVAGAELSDKQDQMLAELEETALSIANDAPALERAQEWVIGKLPRFVYVDEYPALPGRQNIAEFLGREGWGQLTPEQQSFARLCKAAGLDLRQLQALLEKNDQATRNQLVNRAGSVVTAEIRRLWKDRALKVRFNLDGQYLDTLVSDPNAAYEVEVNLEERSRGFQWFFSFYVAFFADTQGGQAEDAVLLLDEPGLHLHAHSQADLLAHLEKDFAGNQVIYTTHSPFMVPTHRLDAVRTASLDETAGTTVSNTAQGDERTLFPLKAALAFARMASEPVKQEAAKPVAATQESVKPAPAKQNASEGAKPAKSAKSAEAVKPEPVKPEPAKPVVAESAKPVEAAPVAVAAPAVLPAPAMPEPAKVAAPAKIEAVKTEVAKPVVVESVKPAEAAPVAVAAPVVPPAEVPAPVTAEPAKPVAGESIKSAEPVAETPVAVAAVPAEAPVMQRVEEQTAVVSPQAEQPAEVA